MRSKASKSRRLCDYPCVNTFISIIKQSAGGGEGAVDVIIFWKKGPAVRGATMAKVQFVEYGR